MTIIYRKLPKDPFKGRPPTLLELLEQDTGRMKPDHIWWWSEYVNHNLHETFPETNVGKDPETHEANPPDQEWIAQRMELIDLVLLKLEDAERDLGRIPPVPKLYMRLSSEMLLPQKRIDVVRGHYEWVLDELDEGMCHRALSVLGKAQRADLLEMFAVFAKGDIYMLLGDATRHDIFYTMGKRINLPSINTVDMARAKAHYNVWKYKKAYRFIKDTTLVLPEHAEAWYVRGAIEYKLEKDRKAGESFDTSIRCDPGFLLAWFGRGVVHELNGEAAKAEGCFRRAEGL